MNIHTHKYHIVKKVWSVLEERTISGKFQFYCIRMWTYQYRNLLMVSTKGQDYFLPRTRNNLRPLIYLGFTRLNMVIKGLDTGRSFWNFLRGSVSFNPNKNDLHVNNWMMIFLWNTSSCLFISLLTLIHDYG